MGAALSDADWERIKSILKWPDHLSVCPSPGLLIISEKIHPEEEGGQRGRRELIFSRSVSTWEQPTSTVGMWESSSVTQVGSGGCILSVLLGRVPEHVAQVIREQNNSVRWPLLRQVYIIFTSFLWCESSRGTLPTASQWSSPTRMSDRQKVTFSSVRH